MVKKLSILLYLTISLFFLGDVLRKIALFFDWEFVRFTALTKTIVLALQAITIIVYFKEYLKNKITRNLILIITALLLVYILGQLSLKEPTDIFTYNKNILILSRYLFWPVTLLVFHPLIGNDYLGKHIKFFEILFLINSGIILFAFIFNIEILETYLSSKRIGYMGFYNTHNQASYAFIAFIYYYYYKVIFKKENALKLFFVIAISLLIGTKKIYFFNILLLIGHLVYFRVYTKKIFHILLLPILAIGFFFKNAWVLFFENNFSVFINIALEKDILTSIMSYRNILLEQTIQTTVMDNWTTSNYLIGGPMFYISRTELGLVDIYIFFGVIGLLAFYYIFKTFYLLANKHKFYLIILITMIFVAFFAEGFFSSANQPLLVLLITSFFILEKNAETKTLVL